MHDKVNEVKNKEVTSTSLGISAFAFSIAGLLVSFFLISIFFEILAIILAVASLYKKEDKKGFSIVAIIISVIAFMISITLGVDVFFELVSSM